jgi:penicillin-binding protein 2
VAVIVDDERSGALREVSRRRLAIVGVVLFAMLAAVVARLYYLQVLDAPAFRAAASAVSYRDVLVPAPRGLILDREGTVLVGNKTVEVVALSRQAARAHPAEIGRLAAALGMTKAAVLAQLSDPEYSPYQPVPIKTNVPLATVLTIEEHEGEFPGVHAELLSERYYPQGPLLGQLLGYVGPVSPSELKAMTPKQRAEVYPGELIGQAGIEAAYNRYLQGKPGVDKVEVTPAGRVIKTVAVTPPTPGDDVQLSISLPLEEQASNLLAAQAHKLAGHVSVGNPLVMKADNGAVVVENPNDGHILAMVSYPYYNPSVWVGGISEAQYQQLLHAEGNPLVNHAIAGVYTPGSTWKVTTATAMLASGLWNPNAYYDDTGEFVIPNCKGPDCRRHNAGYMALGPINIVTAIAASDDVFFYHLGYLAYLQQLKNGSTPIQDFAEQYGFGEPTGFDVPGSALGIVLTPKLLAHLHAKYPKAYPYATWYPGYNVELAIGQAMMAVTPLQIADAYSTFANGGTRFAPRVGVRILSPAGKVLKVFASKVMQHVDLPPSVHNTMLKGFEQEILNPLGTGYYAFLNYPYSKYPIAGKTGTASVTNQTPTGLYASFGPVNTPKPKYAMAVVLNRTTYGDLAAAPVAKHLWEYLMVHPVQPLHGLAQVSGSVSTGATSTSTTSTGAKQGASSTTSTTTSAPSGASSTSGSVPSGRTGTTGATATPSPTTASAGTRAVGGVMAIGTADRVVPSAGAGALDVGGVLAHVLAAASASSGLPVLRSGDPGALGPQSALWTFAANPRRRIARSSLLGSALAVMR